MKSILCYSVLLIAFMSYACSSSQAINNKNQTQIDQGYGSVDASKSTTAINQIELDNEPGNVTWMELLQRTAGVSVTGKGNALSIQIRAKKSMTASHQPLFVVDNIPVGNGFSYVSFIDANQVKRISVLKDAASTSAYGSRGADGVILVTLKK